MFKDIFKDTSVRILITFMVVLCVSASLVLPEWMQNNFLYGGVAGLAVLGLMLLWRTNLISFGHAYIMVLVHMLLLYQEVFWYYRYFIKICNCSNCSRNTWIYVGFYSKKI